MNLIIAILKWGLIFYGLQLLFRSFFSQRTDDSGGYSDQGYSQSGQNPAFEDALLKVMGAAMQADGRIQRSELNVVKQVLVAQFGDDRAKELLLRLRDILKTDIDMSVAAKQIGFMVSYADRIYIADILCQIAEADGIITESEKQTVVNMAYFMGLSQRDVQRIAERLRVNGGERGNFHGGGNYGGQSAGGATDVSSAYETLGLSADATNEDLKTAYRNLVKKYHPDRYATQSAEAQAQAAEKFKEVQDAYDKIKASRGL